MSGKFDDGVVIRNSQTLLPKLLKYGYASTGERRSMLNKEWFKQSLENASCFVKHNHKDYGLESPGRIPAYKALLQSERNAITDTTLVQEQVYSSILAGSQPQIVWRGILPTVNANSYRMRFVKGETGSYAGEVAEGGAVDVDTQTYTSQNVDIKKIGTRPLITEELIQDGLFDVIEQELQYAGRRMENKLNRYVLDKILNGSNAISTSTHNPAGDHAAVTDLAHLIGKIQKQDYMPDTFVAYPTTAAYLMQDSNVAYAAYMGSDAPLVSGKLPTLLGLTPYICTATDTASSPTWGDATAGTSVGGIVFSKNDLGKLVISRDLTVKDYDDPIHDIRGIVLTMRFGFDVNYEKAGGILYHK